jgi:hypothetical protein
MFTIAFTVVTIGLVAFALWSANRGEGDAVSGSGNAFDAYYGKDRFDPGKSPPCQQCQTTGCIGAGACFCRCHRAAKKKK